MGYFKGLAHFGLYVENIEVSKKFYTEVLEFEPVFETSEGTHLCFLRNGACELELIERPGQVRPDGYEEEALVTLGADLDGARRLAATHPGGWTAAQAIEWLLVPMA